MDLVARSPREFQELPPKNNTLEIPSFNERWPHRKVLLRLLYITGYCKFGHLVTT